MFVTRSANVCAAARSYYGFRRKVKKMVAFNSLVVFDTETTGLPHLESNNTRITELALVGCEVSHISNATVLPRVLHKLVLLFNPMKMILPDTSVITGLENEHLMNIKPFSEDDIQAIVHFINRLPSPVCIVAHNGNKFDFPILQKHLHKLNSKLPDTVYCADSIVAFRDIYPNANRFGGKFYKRSYSTPVSGEVTPKKDTLVAATQIPPRVSKNNSRNVARQLFPESESESQVVAEDGSPEVIDLTQDSDSETQPAAPSRYTLSSIYEFLHGKCFTGGHRAEDDARALLSCIIKCEKFLGWMNENAVTFNSIKPLL